MLEGKISVKHYLNDKVAKRNGQLPIYVLVRFQNKDSRFKSRWKFFDTKNIAPLSPLHVVPKYKDQLDYFTQKDFKEKHNQRLFDYEANAIIKIGDYFRKLDINFIEHEPSKIIDYSIVPITDLLSDFYKSELSRAISRLNKNSRLSKKVKYEYFSFLLAHLRDPSVEFGVMIRALNEVVSEDARKDFLDEWILIEKQLSTIDPNFRIIDWLINNNDKENNISGVMGPDFSQKISNDIKIRLPFHYLEIAQNLPKTFIKKIGIPTT